MLHWKLPVSLVTASSSESPSTLGTTTLGGPSEITSFTVVPLSTVVPGAGSVEITLPAAIVSSDLVSVVIVKPLAPSWFEAVARSRFSTLITSILPLPTDTVSVTLLPGATSDAGGSCATTWSTGMVSLSWSTKADFSPNVVSLATASAFGRPTSDGSATVPLPGL